jgi:hypothetical protein
MKFSVLIGLLQVGEVSNSDVMETVLNLVREKASAARPQEHGLLGRTAGDQPARCLSQATLRPGWVHSCQLSAVPNSTPLLITSPPCLVVNRPSPEKTVGGLWS